MEEINQIDCIICMGSFSEEQIITSVCKHGPYCHTCYNNITSPHNPTCSICRGPLIRSNNPNPRYANNNNINNNNNNNNLQNDFNLHFHHYNVVDVINQGNYNQHFIQINQINQVNQVNQVNHVNNHAGDGFTTPPRRPQAPELNQEVNYANKRRTARNIGNGIQFSQMMIGEQ